MATPEQLDDMFVALSRYTRLRDRALHTSTWTGGAGVVETAAYRALFVLRNGPMRSRDLAARLVTDPSTTSRHVAQLVSEGFVRREAHPGDGRAAQLVLTDDGTRKVHEIAEARRQLIGATVEDWTAEEFGTFVRLLGRFVDAVEDRIAPCEQNQNHPCPQKGDV